MGCVGSDEEHGDRYKRDPPASIETTKYNVTPKEDSPAHSKKSSPKLALPQKTALTEVRAGDNSPVLPKKSPPVAPLRPAPLVTELEPLDDEKLDELAKAAPSPTTNVDRKAPHGWKVKPRVGKIGRKAPRLASLETWRSDLIGDAGQSNKPLKQSSPLPISPSSPKSTPFSRRASRIIQSKPSDPLAKSVSPPALNNPAKAPIRPVAVASATPGSEKTPERMPEKPPEKRRNVLSAPTLSRELLGGKLMEVDALLRHRFANRKDLCKVQNSVDAALELLSELPSIAIEANVIEGQLFQELLQRLAENPTNQPVVTSTPSKPRATMVSRTPVQGARRSKHWASAQSIGDFFSQDPERLQGLLRRVAVLRGLLRIKIEDNKDLELARDALTDVKCAIDHLWWYSEDQTPKTGVTALLEELRGV
eukprot:TRINITY_DN8202_c0_g1_i3.p1 TRINITY_DN8202_c0_g1~~TRINITY_DN8202_c0_g1_i3.p1  ORF type:complete len:422 (-),score=54.02 TRINITY_DN8202_c0_g1_i3:211-1476(-)